MRQHQATCSREYPNRLPLLCQFFLDLPSVSLRSTRSICDLRESLLCANPNPTKLHPSQQLPQLTKTPSTMLSFLQNPRQAAAQLLNFGLILSTACMMWKGLSVLADSPSPIVVVLSGSMEPAFQRGDLLFLWNRNFFEETKVGEIVVYNVKGKDIPIVHRVVRKFGVG
jgi:hypothetical protein